MIAVHGSEFTSAQLYAKVTKFEKETGEEKPQAHARRRWKELKYDFGFNVGFSRQHNKYYRGQTLVPIHDPSPRPVDKELRKDFLPHFEAEQGKVLGRSGLTCNFCMSPARFQEEGSMEDLTLEDEIAINFDDDTYGLLDSGAGKLAGPGPEGPKRGLLDHRRPVFQGGEDTVENLQIFCEVCNNLKNGVCRECPYGHECDACVWAHPENTRRLVVPLDHITYQSLRAKYGTKYQQEVEKAFRELASSLAKP